MHNSNWDAAQHFIDSIQDGVTKNLTHVFLSQLAMIRSRGEKPEGDFDLLFFVKVVASVVNDQKLLKMCLDGKPLDVGWEAICDAFPLP